MCSAPAIRRQQSASTVLSSAGRRSTSARASSGLSQGEYGDYLETLTPGVRTAEAAELGAAGFENVGRGDRSPSPAMIQTAYRGLGRYVLETADADATAAKAAELGGTVVAPPIDAPYSRMNSARRPAGSDVLRDGLRAREQRRWPQSHLNGPPRLPNAYHLLSRARTHARARTRSRVLPPPSMR